MPNRPTIVALASAVAIAAAAGGALVAQGSDAPSGPPPPRSPSARSWTAWPRATRRLQRADREGAGGLVADAPLRAGLACEQVVAEAGRQWWMDDDRRPSTVATSGADVADVRRAVVRRVSGSATVRGPRLAAAARAWDGSST